MRDRVVNILDALASNDEEELQEAIYHAELLLEKSTSRFFDREEARAQYQKVLPEEYLDLVLTKDEISAITKALLDLLDRPSVVGNVAWALHRSGQLFALPRLTDTLRRYVLVSSDISHQAIIAIWDIVTAVDTSHLSDEEERWISEACAALRLAADIGIDGVFQVRDVARMALDSIARHLGHSG